MRDEVLETEVIDYQMPGDLSWHELIVVSTLHCSYFVVICPSTTLYLPTWSPRLLGHSFIHVFIQSVPSIYAHTIFSGEFDFGFRADIDARRAIFHSHTNTNTHTHTYRWNPKRARCMRISLETACVRMAAFASPFSFSTKTLLVLSLAGGFSSKLGFFFFQAQ